jgi:uncharacterized protein YdiU (UPF0061 family)
LAVLDDSFEGLSIKSHNQSIPDALRAQWSEMSDPLQIDQARVKAPAWMLSHWLLDQVIGRAEAGDYSAVQSLRKAIHNGVGQPCDVTTELGGSPPDQNSAYHLSCSS